MHRKQGQTIHSEARNIIRRVIRKCDEESRKNQMLYPLKQATIRASDYVGTSVRTISRIRKEDSMKGEDEPLSSPGKKRPRSEDKRFHCSMEDQAAIRDIIYDLYTKKKIVPTGPVLLEAIRNKIDFPWKVSSLYRLLRHMGFQWKKTNSIRKVLIENPSIVAWRSKYLQTIEYYRKQNRNIVYVDERWIDDNLRFHKCWQSKEMLGTVRITDSTNRLVIVHAAGKDGFIPEAGLIFQHRITGTNHNGKINVINFEKWITEKLLPNIPLKSVVVMDNAPYRRVQVNKPPSKYSKREDMIQWLVEHNISHAQDMRKYQLFELIERNKKMEKSYEIDEILKLHGHCALRLPPYICDLNPIELAWSHIKRQLQDKSIYILSGNDFETYTIEAINEVKLSDWHNFYERVEKLEKEYWQKDGLIEKVTDNLDIQSDESESDSDDSTSSEDY